ncbi:MULTISPECIES: BGTF surface domain-containing protein [Haloferax]|uniref:PGF-CTERM sorting domain-containing protein n=1 Tax=Haloferax marinum TaxID=2666143 RepID=A0A6A8G8S9_9EURY|nr:MULTISPECIES: BGTF surface domain-containing protein [Haloferax]KAB1198466.1 PGF-CTERM sorting domain-containing protein [Haloferax sp. CBA1150]MRW97569.1 PGF-CTERM sorting domain-containing protein [Haloferax marinum]
MTRNKQIRAVLLAALMVFSVFAGSIAFSGSAAAAADEILTDEIGDTSTETIEVNVTPESVGDSGQEDAVTVWLDTDEDGLLEDGERNVTTSFTGDVGDQQTVSVTFDADGLTDGEYEFAAAAVEGGPTIGTTTAETNKTLTLATAPQEAEDVEGAPELISAVHYSTTADGNSPVLELSFDEAIDSTDYENITVYRDEEDVTEDVVDSSGTITQTPSGQVVIPTNDLFTGDLEVNLEGVTDNGGNQVDEGLDSDFNATITVATVTIVDGNTETVNAYRGEVVALTDNSPDTAIEIESDDDQDDNEAFFRAGNTGDTSSVYTFDTSNRELERYNVSIAGGSDGKIQVRDLGLDVTVDDLTITDEDTLEGTVSANAGGRPIDVNLLDDDGDEEFEINDVTLDGQGEYDFEIDISAEDIDTGDYTVEAVDKGSGVSVESDTVTISEAAEGDADFAQNVVTDQRGDVVAIPITLSNTDVATVTIGSEDQGYAANVTVEDGNDDGEVILLWDSSKSTTDTNVGTAVFDVDDSDDDILTGSDGQTEVTTPTSDLIDAGDYDLEVRTGDTATDDNADNVGTLVLEEGGVQTVATWTAPNSESFGDLDDVTEALEDGNITQDDQIAFGDKVVVQIVASGLEGSTGAQGDETPNFFGSSYGDSYQLVINQTNPGPNRDPKTLNVTDADVIADGDNDTYFVVFNSEDIDAQREADDTGVYDLGDGADSEAAPEDDDAYQIEFKMVGEDDVDSATALVEDNSSMTAEYSNVEATHDFDADPANVTNAEAQAISGSSTVAPGSELTVRVKSDGDTQPRFLKTGTAYVQNDGTWSAEFDFSEQSVGDTFTVTVSGGVADEEEIDGNVGEPVEETTETTTTEETTTTTEETTTEETTTEETTTEETTTEATTEETTTESQTPGFGVVVALVALVAAALLAIRRD